jgi:hypothetical protein
VLVDHSDLPSSSHCAANVSTVLEGFSSVDVASILRCRLLSASRSAFFAAVCVGPLRATGRVTPSLSRNRARATYTGRCFVLCAAGHTAISP